MDDDRQLDAAGQIELLSEGNQLAVAGRILAVEVETDFADGDDSGVPGKLFEGSDLVVAQAMGVVGVDAGGGEDGLMTFGDLDTAPARFDIGAGADDAIDPGFSGAGDDILTVGVELLECEVGVGIYDSGAGGQLLPPAAISPIPPMACSVMKRSMPSRTSMAAVGVVKLAVPTWTALAPAMKNSMASSAVVMPPQPTTGMSTARATS